MSGRMITITPETFFDTTLTPEQRKPAFIYSVYPVQAVITHGAQTIVVPPCEPGMRVAKSEPIGPGREIKDYGNDQKLVLESISSYDNALDAIGLTKARINSRGESIQARTSSDWWESGYFVPEGAEPTEAEIAAARSRLKAWAQRWLDKGDEAFSVDQKPARVDFRAKLAARILKVRRAWAEGHVETTDTIPCPSCRLPMVSGATKCSQCGDRFVYVDGKPVLREDAGLVAAQLPTTPPPGKAQGRI